MQLSDRLLALAQMVSVGNTLADVGCDHGYISIYVVEYGIVHRAIAMDVGRGPLAHARENIARQGMGGVIETRLSDGLAGIRRGECDRIVIAGMGGPLMESILAKGAAVVDEQTELVLQPQSHVSHFRKFLMENGYGILHENMIYEDGKYYPMMKVRRQEAAYSKLECRYGPALLEMRHPILKLYLEKEIATLQALRTRLTGNGNAQERMIEIEEELQMAVSAREKYDS